MKSFVLLLFIPLMSYTQLLDKHQWKDRLLLVIADSYESTTLQQQITSFKDSQNALKERKLVVYQITPSDFKKGLLHTKRIKGNPLYQQYNNEQSEFKLILIGLDGDVKATYFNPTPPKTIYNLIDQMPMRRQELKRKN
ncbi:DUF4174 domain-containing protein [Aquimarina brevivitae]|uniref:Uncharacterized protein DUF4174 n=1 Tax=Aquimarina brevivitae TaxID=323412 RepID=A0A4Q7NTP1_9FLAO|nr:DUF4174 domain-containing protein [Aquimarina brevivitae]RZS90553.1 uncharacterized protein DUF4174 [Aquimarina brevivitae]